jgi:transcriptional regulator with XRE-family HTH domain
MYAVASQSCPGEDARVDLEVFMTRLRQLMDERGLSVTRLVVATGISDKTIRRYREGAHVPSSSHLLKLADALGVSTDYLLGRSDWDGVERRARAEGAWDNGSTDPGSPGEAGPGPPLDALDEHPKRHPRRRGRRSA